MNINVHENEYSQRVYDSSFGESLVKFFKTENIASLADLGCGKGCYAKKLQEHNINTVGFDGNLNNLSVQKIFDGPFDWAIYLEVSKTLPPQFEDIFIQNLHDSNRFGILLCWDGENSDYIKSKICELGYINDIEIENEFRKSSSLDCFKNTIMVFRKIYYYEQYNYNLCLLHNKPEHLNYNIEQLPNIYNIGNYTNDYRKYFNDSKSENFMIDIGANMGLSACPILSLGHKVVCFEPELLNVEILKRIKEKNNYDNMIIENFAVIGEKGKNKTVFYSNINREDNSSINEECCGKNVNNIGILTKEVNSITLDEWFEINKNDFSLCNLLLIKIDVQGGELGVLKGASETLKQSSAYGICQVEIECDEGFMRAVNIDFDTINNIMDSYGYLCKHRGYDSVFIPKKNN